MKTDKYTKVVLTIIAICLINLSLGGISPFLKHTLAAAPFRMVPMAWYQSMRMAALRYA
ncbi:MAG: hypothetical protein HEP71_34005 [Roseivirga sp.]|nr:hypothetical protein [Roseivirga sp.]